MFRLEAFVDDKKLPKAMRALDGLVVQLTAVPVRNAVAKRGKVAAAGQPVSGPDVVMDVMRKAAAAGHTTFTRREVVEAGRSYGVPDTATYSAMNNMVARKALKKKGHGVFLVNKGEK